MTRIKIDLPEHFSFITSIPVRITDVNYGGHVGNDSILSIIHEARVQYLNSMGYSEMNMEGAGLIMKDVVIEFKNELFYGETIQAFVTAGEFSKVSFSLFYKFVKKRESEEEIVVIAKTGMVCFDYGRKRMMSLPPAAKEKLSVI